LEQNKQMVKSLSDAMLSIKGQGRRGVQGVQEVTESVLGHKEKPKSVLEQLSMPSHSNKMYAIAPLLQCIIVTLWSCTTPPTTAVTTPTSHLAARRSAEPTWRPPR
jgi:hypothetical protein